MAFSSGASSTRDVRFDVATECCHSTRFTVAGDALFGLKNESIELGFCDSIFLKRVIVGMHSDRSQRDDLICVENADVFAFSRSF